jgi:hypothetical protein
VSLDDAIGAARDAAALHDRDRDAESADAAQTTALAAEAVVRLTGLGDETYVRVERARVFRPAGYLDYIGARYRPVLTLRCWTVLAAKAPVLLLEDGSLGRFRPPRVPLQRTSRATSGTELVTTDELDVIGDAGDPFASPYDSFVDAVRHRLAAAIVRYQQQAQAAAGSAASSRR